MTPELPQIDTDEFSILCWFNWCDGPLSGLMSWHYKVYWFQHVDRWGVDEEKEIWEEEWGYIYEVYELTDVQMEEAVDWFKEKGDWFHNQRLKNEDIELRDWDGPKLPKTGVATFTDKSGLRGGDEGDFALPQGFTLFGRGKQVHISEQEVLAFLKKIETGEVTLIPQLDPQVHIKSDIPYKASNGWVIEISNWSGQFSGIDEIILPNGEVLDVDFLDTHMQNVCLYSPDPEVEWRAYRMKETITGYIYRPMDKLGLFQNCSVGQVISKANDNPPWIIVHHSLDDTLAANWPGRLWRAEVLGALDPQGHTGNYTRCVSVKIIKEMKTEILFGEFGAKIQEILHFASTLELPTAQHLVNSRHEDAKNLTSEAWHRWIKTNGSVDRNPNDDMSGVIAIGGNARKSPIGPGLSLVHRCVRDAAKRAMGEAAFEEDDEGIWLIQPWSDAAGVLKEAAWAFGAPDLFNQVKIDTLLKGWNQREVSKTSKSAGI